MEQLVCGEKQGKGGRNIGITTTKATEGNIKKRAKE